MITSLRNTIVAVEAAKEQMYKLHNEINQTGGRTDGTARQYWHYVQSLVEMIDSMDAMLAERELRAMQEAKQP
jgi:soluble cytochrome b562